MKIRIILLVMLVAIAAFFAREPIKIGMGKRTEGPCFPPFCGEQGKLIARANQARIDRDMQQHHPYPFGGRTE